MRTITLTYSEENHWCIAEENRSVEHLCWDEMLGSVAELTHPMIGNCRYRMRTPEEKAEYEAARAERIAAIQLGRESIVE